MTKQQAIMAAENYGNKNGQSIMVYEWNEQFHLAHTLPTFGKRVGRYYPSNYSRSGWVMADERGNW